MTFNPECPLRSRQYAPIVFSGEPDETSGLHGCRRQDAATPVRQIAGGGGRGEHGALEPCSRAARTVELTQLWGHEADDDSCSRPLAARMSARSVPAKALARVFSTMCSPDAGIKGAAA